MSLLFLTLFNVQDEESQRRRQLKPPKFLSQRELCAVLSSRPSPMSLDWLATSVFHFSLAIALGQLSRETLLFWRHIQDPYDKISPRQVTQGKIGNTLKIKFPQVDCQQLKFTQVKSLQCDLSYYIGTTVLAWGHFKQFGLQPEKTADIS